ncbi:MAG: hypothetical protein MHM6MM_007920 [Cercozoa sp. M6MM]
MSQDLCQPCSSPEDEVAFDAEGIPLETFSDEIGATECKHCSEHEYPQPLCVNPFSLDKSKVRAMRTLSIVAMSIVAISSVLILLLKSNRQVFSAQPYLLHLSNVGLFLMGMYGVLNADSGNCAAAGSVAAVGLSLFVACACAKLYQLDKIYNTRRLKKVKLTPAKLVLFALSWGVFTTIYVGAIAGGLRFKFQSDFTFKCIGVNHDLELPTVLVKEEH